MLAEDAVAAASDCLWEAWAARRRMPAIPAAIRPETRADGYRIQARLERRSARPPIGWKIAATSLAGQRHIAVDGPLAGRLLAERCFASGAELVFGDNLMAVAEPEFCFRMGRTLSPRPDPFAADEVLDAVAALHLALEVPDSRFDDFTLVGAAQLIADDACAHEFVLGPEVPTDWRTVDLAGHAVEGRVAGGAVHRGTGAAVLGDPRIALAWLANELRGLGLPLAAGAVVTTGTCMTPLPIGPGAAVTADFGRFGTVSVRFGA